MKDDSVEVADKEKVLIELIADYPFEETFYRKLSSFYHSKDEFPKALAANEKALKYSYGKMWLYNVLKKSEILKALNKDKEAYAILEKALDEVSIEKESRDGVVLKMVRNQYEELKKKVL